KTKDHIACSPQTKSEIVLPVFDAAGELVAVLDIDSTVLGAFDNTDLTWLKQISENVCHSDLRSPVFRGDLG
ncbi:MAG: GAF domain-containing protein, partial [Opitutales bacterium]